MIPKSRGAGAPPPDVAPSELVAKLQERPRPSEVVDFPRYNDDGTPVCQVRLMVLTGKEQKWCAAQAIKRMREELELTEAEINSSVIQEGAYATAVAEELLALSVCSVKPLQGSEERAEGPIYAKQFSNGRQVEKELLPDEIGTLFVLYQMVQRKFGPYATDFETDEDVNAYLAALVRGGSEYPLASLDSFQLYELLRCLAARTWCLSSILDTQLQTLPESLASELRTWAIGTGFFGSPLDDGISTSSQQESRSGMAAVLLKRNAEPVNLATAADIAKQLTALR